MKLEWQMDVSCQVGAGNQTRSSTSAASAPNCWAISPLPRTFCFKDFLKTKSRKYDNNKK